MRAFLIIFLVFASLGGCTRREPASAVATDSGVESSAAVRFDTPRGTWIVRTELARTDDERTRGLMYRRSLAPDTGMLFLFDGMAERTFWMRNTFLSLDLIFIADDRTVVGVVANAEPQNDLPRTVHKPSRYVLEVSAGEAYAHAVGPGSRAIFVGVPE